jgi:Ca2+-transporting ATPase
MRSLRDIADLFPQSARAGLTSEQVAQSRERFGANRLTPLPREPVWKKFLERFDEPIIRILLAASLLKIVVDLFETSALAGALGLVSALLLLSGSFVGRIRDWVPSLLFALAAVLVVVSALLGDLSYEGLAIMVAVALATGVAFLSEYRSDQEFEKLNANKDAIQVKVLRDGAVHVVPLEDVVVGDLVLLEMGDEIPADGRVVKANELLLDQSLMTGESEPVKKHAVRGENDDGSIAWRGTQVIDGIGQMTATNVGDDTMLGAIARKLSGDTVDEAGTREERVQRKLAISKAATPLQEKLTVLARVISKVGYWASIAIFFALLIRGLWVGEIRWPGPDDDVRRVHLASVKALLSYFVYMVIVVVVAVPEGLPMSVTVSLAIAMRKMTRANALVRQLVATETIGSATVICSDKTGTLTQNRMTVVRVGTAGEVFEADVPHAEPIRALVLNAAINSTASLTDRNGVTHTVGNTTEGALLQWLRSGAGIQKESFDYSALRAEYPILFQIHFSSERKRMTTVIREDGKLIALVKGAPEPILADCDAYLDSTGTAQPIEAMRETITAQIRDASAHAMRTLAFAQAELPPDFPDDEHGIKERRAELDGRLTFVGFVAIRDPLRDDVPQAIAECRGAGIDVKMITGDNAETARAIARDAGLLDSPDCLVMTSAELHALTDDEVKERLPRLRVLARAKPLDKYRLVKLLQEQNHVVAMTGDGTNDAPSLKKADVGLAMGIAGTEVAKEASKIVLLDDAFSTIVRAVHWGRALYQNIQRFIQFQLTINVSALAIAFLGPFLGYRPPFTVLQLLWINVIMDTFAAIALCSEPPRRGLMDVPPKRRDERILTRSMLGTILATAGFFVIAMLGLLEGMEQFGWFGGDTVSPDFAPLTVRQVTIFFTVYVFFQVWNQINCRSLSPRESGLRGLAANPAFLAIGSLTVIGQLLIVQFGGAVFSVEPLALIDWLLIAVSTASVLIFAEVMRQIRLVRRGL